MSRELCCFVGGTAFGLLLPKTVPWFNAIKPTLLSPGVWGFVGGTTLGVVGTSVVVYFLFRGLYQFFEDPLGRKSKSG